MGEVRVRAARGAIRVGDDTPEDVLAATERLLDAMFERNGVDRDDIVSVFFTATGDLHSAFPAEARSPSTADTCTRRRAPRVSWTPPGSCRR